MRCEPLCRFPLARQSCQCWILVATLWLWAPVAPAQGLYEKFIEAVTTDRSDEVSALLARGIDPNTVDPNADPVLLIASRAGFETSVDALLKARAKIDAKNRYGDTPIMVAALGGHLAIVKKLHRRGADVDPEGWTPLSYAATNGHTAVVAYLLDSGARVDAEGPNGTTALMMAVRGGHQETAQLLISKGADINHRNQNGASALAWAKRDGLVVIEQLLRRAGAKD